MKGWSRRKLIFGTIAALILILVSVGAAWLLSLPARPDPYAAAIPPPAETAGTLQSLQPRRRGRPVVAVLGINDATETTDYLMPIGILRRADVADVIALATRPAPVQLYPALRVVPDATIAQFDRRFPRGADYVVVPAMTPDDDPAALAWIRAQAAKGAMVIGICAGAKVVANAGLLEKRRATTHWYYARELLKRHPSIDYVTDRRFVADGRVATTTGITASMPMMLTLIEAIGGRTKAAAVARDLGVTHWDARHSSGAFRLTRQFALTVMGNRARLWNQEEIGIPLVEGVDEVALALSADAWSRTYRSSARAFAPSSAGVRGTSGLRILPDVVAVSWPADRRVQLERKQPAAASLDRSLAAIRQRYGDGTGTLVAMQLEYAGRR